MDLTRPISFRGIALNTTTITVDVGISGYTVDRCDYSELQVRQFTEPLARADGVETGGIWIGGRIIQMQGTIYGVTRGEAYQKKAELEVAMLPVSGTYGEYQLTFWVLTDAGAVQKYMMVRPNGLRVIHDGAIGGEDDTVPLAIPWSVSFLAFSPAIVSV